MRLTALAILLAILPQFAHAAPLKIVASFSVLGDLVKQVGGDEVSVTTLVGPNGDTHVYEPKPADAEAIAHADLLVVNGLGLEGWMDRLKTAANYTGPVVVAAEKVTPLHSDSEGTDPHAWQSVTNAILYTDAIETGLAKTDPGKADYFHQQANSYRTKLRALDAFVRQIYVPIPQAKRVVITTHDAFGYYGRDYDVKFLAAEGMSTEDEATAKDVGALITQIRQTGIHAVFIENMSDPRLIQRIASEAGVKLSGELYSDALSEPSGPAATYIDMVRHNTEELAKAMAGN